MESIMLMSGITPTLNLVSQMVSLMGTRYPCFDYELPDNTEAAHHLANFTMQPGASLGGDAVSEEVSKAWKLLHEKFPQATAIAWKHHKNG